MRSAAPRRGPRLAVRGALASAFLAAEWIAVSALIHPRIGGSYLAWFLTSFASVFLALGYPKIRRHVPAAERISRRRLITVS